MLLGHEEKLFGYFSKPEFHFFQQYQRNAHHIQPKMQKDILVPFEIAISISNGVVSCLLSKRLMAGSDQGI